MVCSGRDADPDDNAQQRRTRSDRGTSAGTDHTSELLRGILLAGGTMSDEVTPDLDMGSSSSHRLCGQSLEKVLSVANKDGIR